jgi:hypothetical protein
MQCYTEDPVSRLWEQELHQAQQLLDKFAVHQKRLWDGILQKQWEKDYCQSFKFKPQLDWHTCSKEKFIC